MPKAKKKFIDKKKAVTFNLVHRSQRDPLAADETAPQRVLVPVNAVVPPKKEKDPDYTPEQRIEEQRKYGIYFDDDYNYLQHLKDTKEVTMVLQPKATHKRKEKANEDAPDMNDDDEKVVKEKFTLPSSVFASEVEEDVGLLNKAASQGLCLNLDPEVVAALDEDFDFEDPDNQLEDNFIELAMGEGEGDDDEEYEDESDMSDDGSEQAFASDDLDSDDESEDSQRRGKPGRMPNWDPHDKEETKSRFSQYSMSSSVMRRNDGLTLLDDRFEKMFAEYDDTEIGALDLDEIEGFMPESHARLLQAAEEMEGAGRGRQLDKEREIQRIRRLQEIEEESEEDLEEVEVTPQEKWDCETILSTYSNLYNHPKLIEEPRKPQKIQIHPKTGIPKDVLGTTKLTLSTLAKFNAQQPESVDEDAASRADTVLSTLSVLSLRPKDESADDKKERKRLLKEYRKERRVEKKANKEAFKEEKKRQEKIMLNNRNNVQGNRIL